MRGNAHAGFGERPAETDRWRRRHRAAGRLNHPGAQLRIKDANGMRITCFATNTADRPIAELELRHHLRARAEDRIRATGLRNLPLHQAAQNKVWLEIVQIALDLLARMPMLAPTGQARLRDLGTCGSACSPRPDSLSPPASRRILRLARHWPWTHDITAALDRLAQLPNPG
ncbi:transposase [Streptomyces sp. NPDC056160]|uniref:transposase n=1 Tax=Streptomyces sp. NPDC056160 TaxID=3345731 RepID=UPI0035E18AA8